MSFEDSLCVGKLGESQIASWLRKRGNHVMPVYEVSSGQYKGPTIFPSYGGDLIAPDMFVFNKDRAFWVEAKHKEAFSWHRKTRRWVTGIDVRHYRDYKKLGEISQWDVWLLFLHKGGQAKDSPANSPSGLYGNRLEYLIENENHRHENWGSSGMVYWAEEHLKKLSSYSLEKNHGDQFED